MSKKKESVVLTVLLVILIICLIGVIFFVLIRAGVPLPFLKQQKHNALEKALNDNSLNTTRFAVFSRAKRHHLSQEMGVHTILLFTVRNEAGALAGAIDIIGKHGFNMRTLRSRPMKTLLWQYYFYVEIDGTTNTENGEKMISELSIVCDKLKVAGTFAPHTEI